jgi:hypothetical protein
MRIVAIVTLALIGLSATTLSSRGATMGAARIEAGPSHAVSDAACVWRRIIIRGHHNAAGAWIPRHRSLHRHWVCD